MMCKSCWAALTPPPPAPLSVRSLAHKSYIPFPHTIFDNNPRCHWCRASHQRQASNELTIEESMFIDWMLGGMRRTQDERDVFAAENEVSGKWSSSLTRCSNWWSEYIWHQVHLSDKDENDDTPGGIDGEELFALMYRARDTLALRRRRALLGIKDKKETPQCSIKLVLRLSPAGSHRVRQPPLSSMNGHLSRTCSTHLNRVRASSQNLRAR